MASRIPSTRLVLFAKLFLRDRSNLKRHHRQAGASLSQSVINSTGLSGLSMRLPQLNAAPSTCGRITVSNVYLYGRTSAPNYFTPERSGSEQLAASALQDAFGGIEHLFAGPRISAKLKHWLVNTGWPRAAALL